MKPLIAVALLLIFSTSLYAASGTLSFAWDSYADAANITGFKLYATKNSGAYTSTPIATFTTPTATTGTVTQPGYGKYYFVLTAYLTDASGTYESGYSNEVSAVLNPSAPKLNTVTKIAQAIWNGITDFASLFGYKKNPQLTLRIINVG